MRVVISPANELPEKLATRWAEIQENNPGLASPFFRPEFTQAVARVREDVFVAAVDDGAAFFPYQRSSFGLGRPVGGTMSDYHGLIAPPAYKCDMVELLRACRLQRWTFDHVPADQIVFARWRTINTSSPILVISGAAPAGSSSLHSNHRRKWRRLEEGHGEIQVDLDVRDPELLDLCIKWKSEQYHRSGNLDLFARPWARDLVNIISTYHDPHFAGMLSVLRVDGRPIAVHFGIRSLRFWHYWFPAYDPAFQRYSPGILLLLKMIERAPALGIEAIDFGKGDNHYKLRLFNHRVPLIEGCVAASHPLWMATQTQTKLKQLVKSSPASEYIIPPMRRLMQWARFR